MCGVCVCVGVGVLCVYVCVLRLIGFFITPNPLPIPHTPATPPTPPNTTLLNIFAITISDEVLGHI